MATPHLQIVDSDVNVDPTAESPSGTAQSAATDRLWLAVSDADKAVIEQIGFTGAVITDVLRYAHSRDHALDASLRALVQRHRHVVLVGDRALAEQVRLVMAAALLLRQVAEAGVSVSITYPQFDAAAGSLEQLYVHFAPDDRRTRRMLKKARRPANADDLINYMSRRWNRWSPTKRDRELRRAVTFLSFFAAGAVWKQQLATALNTSVATIEALSSKAFEAVGAEEAAAFEREGWTAADGYSITRKGVTRVGKKKHIQISTAPINISEIGADEHGRTYCEVRFMYRDAERRVIVPRAAVAGHELLTLAANGAPVTSANLRDVVRFLAAQEAEHHNAIPFVNVYTQCGWSPDEKAFVLGEHVIGAPARSVVQAEPRFLAGLRQHGCEPKYKTIVVEARNKSSVAEAAWASGYAPPLLRLLGLRGLVLSIWGPSGSGKTAGQALAMSPWGRPEALKLTGDVTPTALEAYLAMSRDLIVHLDDTQLTRRQDLLDLLAYQSASGTGRGRGTQTGGLRSVATWLCVLFVSGEKPLLREGSAAGYVNRLLEIEAAPFETAFARDLHQHLDQHHGHTGPLFVERLMKICASTNGRATLRESFEREVKVVGTETSERAKQVALLVLADYLARTLVFGEDDEPSLQAARGMGRDMITCAHKQASTTPDTVTAAYDEIIAWVAEYADHFDIESTDNRKVARRFGAFPSMLDGRRVAAILPGPFAELAASRRFDREQVLHGLHARGLLIKGEDDRLGKRTRDLGTDRPRAYWIVIADEVRGRP